MKLKFITKESILALLIGLLVGLTLDNFKEAWLSYQSTEYVYTFLNQFKETNSKQLSSRLQSDYKNLPTKTIDSIRRLGALKSYKITERDTSVTNSKRKGKFRKATIDVKAKFKNGNVKLQFQLIKFHGVWYCTNLKVYPDNIPDPPLPYKNNG